MSLRVPKIAKPFRVRLLTLASQGNCCRAAVSSTEFGESNLIVVAGRYKALKENSFTQKLRLSERICFTWAWAANIPETEF